MTRTRQLAVSIAPLTLSCIAWLLCPIPTQAAPITDSFQFNAVGKEWCQGNPKFLEIFAVRITDGVNATFTRDPLNTDALTTIHATITNTGSADLDAITLKGLAFPSNKARTIAQLMLFGTNPSNPDHFITLRGQATFNKLGTLLKVTGTLWDRMTATYTIDKHGTQSAPVECIDTVMFVTGKHLP